MRNWTAVLHVEAPTASGDLEIHGFASQVNALRIGAVIALALQEHYDSIPPGPGVVAMFPTSVGVNVKEEPDATG